MNILRLTKADWQVDSRGRKVLRFEPDELAKADALLAQVQTMRAALEAMVSDVNRSDYHTRRLAFEKARAALEPRP